MAFYDPQRLVRAAVGATVSHSRFVSATRDSMPGSNSCCAALAKSWVASMVEASVDLATIDGQQPCWMRSIMPARILVGALEKKEQGSGPCSKNCVDPISPQSWNLILRRDDAASARQGSSRDLDHQAQALGPACKMSRRPSLLSCHHCRQRMFKVQAVFETIGNWPGLLRLHTRTVSKR